MNRSAAKGWLLLSFVLIAGMLIGSAVERRRPSLAPIDPMNPANVMRILDSSLALDAMQHEKIAAILTRRQAAIDSAWRVLKPSIRAATDSSEMEIIDVLRPEQAEKLMTLMKSSHPVPRHP